MQATLYYLRHTIPVYGWAMAVILLCPVGSQQAIAAGYTTPSEYRIAHTSGKTMRQQLLRHFQKWEGAPYRFGGNSKYGVDCSGFVHIAFRDVLGIEVPRSTQLLARTGRRVSYRRLTAGDIVLFKTSRTGLHTGIYVGNNQFIHASKSKGVMLSKLSPYWQRAYYKSVRVL